MMISIPLKVILPKDLSTISLTKKDGLILVASKYTNDDIQAIRSAGYAIAIDDPDKLNWANDVMKDVLAAPHALSTWRFVSPAKYTSLTSALYVALQEILNCSTSVPACHQSYDRDVYHALIAAHTKLTQH